MFFDDDDFEDSSDEQLQLWQEDELTRYINSFERKLSEEDKSNLQFDIIEKYFPGISNLTDDELIRQKYCSSLHHFQYLISVKRMFEISGRESAISDMQSWTFVFAGEGL